LQDFINELFIRRKEINVLEILKLLPQYDKVVANAKVGMFKLFMSDLVSKYNEDAEFSIIINPNNIPEEHVEIVKKANKIVFNKDAFDIVLCTYLDLVFANED
jgi:hypothetical protein